MRLILTLAMTAAIVPSFAAEPPLAPLPAGREFHRAVVVDSKVVAIGGRRAGKPCKRIDVFDPTTGKWSQRKIPHRHTIAAYPAVVDGQLFTLDAMNKSFRQYDLANDRWTDLISISTNRVNGTVVAHDRKVYVIGGYSKDVSARNSVEIYDTKTRTWSVGPPLPEYEQGDHFHMAAVLNGTLHVVGHYFGGKEHWMLDDGRWRKRADAPHVCGYKMACLETVGDRMYLFNASVQHSRKADGAAHDMFVYSSADDRWTPIGRLPRSTPNAIFASAAVGNMIYLIGGIPNPQRICRYDTAKRTWAFSPNDADSR